MCIGVIVRAYNKFSPISSYPNTWDEFARECTQTRWIVVSLKNGDAYAGYLHIANTSVNASERDLILTEPAKFNKDNNSYVAQDYQYIFFPADLIKSIGVVHDPDLDLRVSKVGEPLFLDEENSDEEAFNEKG